MTAATNDAAETPQLDDTGDQPRRRRSSAEKDAEARADLEPLAPGERPGPVTVAAIVAAVLAISNIVAFAFRSDSTGDESRAVSQLVLFTAVLGAAAWGLWQAKYWAVLGFQALLALFLLGAALSITLTSNLRWAITLLILMAGAGVLFWKLIRAMARIQMPEAPETEALRQARAKLAERDADATEDDDDA